MSEFLDAWVFGLLASTVRFATPLILAGLGGLFSERAGVINIALEGMMLMGAYFAIFGSTLLHHWIGGLILATLAGAALGLLHAIATITFRSDQIVIGTAILLLAAGLSTYLYESAGTAPVEVSRPPVLPLFGGISLMIPMAIGLVLLAQFLLFRTPWGLHLRAVGEHPKAADTVGIPVYRTRYVAVIISGALAGLGGAYVSMNVGNFSEGMTAGKGFIALAAVILGRWNPLGVLAAAMLFGFAEALGTRLEGQGIPSELVKSLPYIFTLVALAGVVGRSKPPAAIGEPYSKGGR